MGNIKQSELRCDKRKIATKHNALDPFMQRVSDFFLEFT